MTDDDAPANVVPFAGKNAPLDEVKDADLINHFYMRAHRCRSFEDAVDVAADFLEKNLGMDTIVHAAAIAALASASVVANSAKGVALKMDSSPEAHGLVVWKFLEEFGGFDDGPKRIIQYRKMLYPRFEQYFAKTIDRSTMNWMIDQAKITLQSGRELHPSVRFHLEGVAAGIPPFGYSVSDE